MPRRGHAVWAFLGLSACLVEVPNQDHCYYNGGDDHCGKGHGRADLVCVDTSSRCPVDPETGFLDGCVPPDLLGLDASCRAPCGAEGCSPADGGSSAGDPVGSTGGDGTGAQPSSSAASLDADGSAGPGGPGDDTDDPPPPPECEISADCDASEGRPFCHEGSCRTCSDMPIPDAACAEQGLPRCYEGVCGSCSPLDEGSCRVGNEYLSCASGELVCTACAAHPDCVSGACDLVHGTCIPVARVLWVDQNASEGGDGSRAAPYASLEGLPTPSNGGSHAIRLLPGPDVYPGPARLPLDGHVWVVVGPTGVPAERRPIIDLEVTSTPGFLGNGNETVVASDVGFRVRAGGPLFDMRGLGDDAVWLDHVTIDHRGSGSVIEASSGRVDLDDVLIVRDPQSSVTPAIVVSNAAERIDTIFTGSRVSIFGAFGPAVGCSDSGETSRIDGRLSDSLIVVTTDTAAGLAACVDRVIERSVERRSFDPDMFEGVESGDYRLTMEARADVGIGIGAGI